MSTSITPSDAQPPTRSGEPGRDRVADLCQPDLDGLDGQRGRRPLQRLPLDRLGLHAERWRTGSLSPPARATRTAASPPAPTTTRSRPRTPPGNVSAPLERGERASSATSIPPSAPGTLNATGRHRQGDAELGRGHGQRRRRPLQRPPRYDARASPRARPTGSRSRPGRATPTPASPPAPTSTRSPPRTPPATSALPPTKRARRRRPTRRRPRHRPTWQPRWRAARST